MLKINKNKFFLILIGVLLLEILSWLAFNYPIINGPIFFVLVILALGASFYNLESGLLIVGAELLIGSLGHLFSLEIYDLKLSLRVALWLVVMSVFAIKFSVQLWRYGRQAEYYQRLKNFRAWPYFLPLFIFIVFGLINGYWGGNGGRNLFLDANAYFYFSLLLPFIVAWPSSENSRLVWWKTILGVGVLWLSLKTLFLFFIFSHDSVMAGNLYAWLRQTLVGEMTPTKTGWPRIFIQGQIYSALAFLTVFWVRLRLIKWSNIFKEANWAYLILAGLFLSTVLISFSRSFWLALIVTIAVSILWLWYFDSWQTAARSILILSSSMVLAFGFIYLVVAFPYWHRSQINIGSSFLERIDSGENEAALASRWSLLPVLLKNISDQPIIGSGYGATVTYYSRDPRVLSNNPEGRYTTYAFEWGYLDIWLKLGILGLAAYFWLLFGLLRQTRDLAMINQNKNYLAFFLIFLFIAITHIFTPYLNHPLGIGVLLVSSCLIWINKVY